MKISEHENEKSVPINLALTNGRNVLTKLGKGETHCSIDLSSKRNLIQKKEKSQLQLNHNKTSTRHPDSTAVWLKGLSTLKWTRSGFKDCELQILPLTFIFDFGETPESRRNSGQKNVKSY